MTREEFHNIKPEEPKQKNAPKRNDGYFYVDDGGFVQCAIWNDSNQDFFRLDVGNVYYAQSVANGAAERVKAALKGKESEELSEGEKDLLKVVRYSLIDELIYHEQGAVIGIDHNKKTIRDFQVGVSIYENGRAFFEAMKKIQKEQDFFKELETNDD